MKRLIRLGLITAPLQAAVFITLAGAVTPGYDPMRRTISWLAVPGVPVATAVDAAITLVAASCILLALVLTDQPKPCRIALTLAGSALAVAAVVPLNPDANGMADVHHLSSGAATGALISAALLWSGPGKYISRALGVIEAGVFASAAVLPAVSFDAWGAWQRALFGLVITWMLLAAARYPAHRRVVLSADATALRPARNRDGQHRGGGRDRRGLESPNLRTHRA